uniref:hypothetical protein n=1 Tax=Microbulbifer agarilyticus TaxID=260552 RepID=UPI000255B666|nr:hypothetical protein [Microbulbifer agarilyticus]
MQMKKILFAILLALAAVAVYFMQDKIPKLGSVSLAQVIIAGAVAGCIHLVLESFGINLSGQKTSKEDSESSI